MGDGGGPGDGQPRDDGEDGGEGHRGDETQQHIAPQVMRGVQHHHVAASRQASLGDLVIEVEHDEGHRAKTDEDHHQIEITDDGQRVKGGLASVLRVFHREQPHQHMGQADETEQTCQAQGKHRDRIVQPAAGGQQFNALGVRLDRAAKDLANIKSEMPRRQEGQEGAANHQQKGLDDLHPSGGQHPPEGDIQHHQGADAADGPDIIQTEQQLDQLASAHQLRDQVEDDGGQGAQSRHHGDGTLRQAIGHHIDEGVTPQVAQTLRYEQQQEGPAGHRADHQHQAVRAIEKQQAGQA